VALGAHLTAFAATALLGYRLMGPGAPPVGAAAFVAWAACAFATVILAAGIAAPAGALASLALRHLRVPLFAVAIGLLSWRAVAAAEGLWGTLQGATLLAVAALLQLVSPDVVVIPAESVIGLAGFEVVVAPECSGVDGLGLVLVFQAVWLSLARSRVRLGPALLLLVPAGALAALAANVARIAALILLGAAGREDLAMGAFHSKLGWLLFIGIALASVTVAEHAPFLRRKTAQVEEATLPAAAGAYVGPLIAALAAALVTSLWAEPGFDRWYGVRIAAAAVALFLARSSLPRPSLSLSWMPWAVAAVVCGAWLVWGGTDGSTLPGALDRLGTGERASWIATRLIGSILVIPIVEELAFRGFLLPWLVTPDLDALAPRRWPWAAILVSSLAFGALHEQWILGATAGAAFAAARVWRGRLGDAIVAHAACNAGIACAVLIGGRWDLWG
jgi:exosortase E/protease (VPEID-CTERM system)